MRRCRRHGRARRLIADQQTWLAVSRQLSADLSGEVSRLARASASQQCVCHDAHPRLRPIAETIERQLVVLEACIQEQRRALSATELQGEIDGLVRTQAELRRHLEHLLDRRQAHTFGARSAREDANGAKTGLQRGRCRAIWKAAGWSWNRSGSGSWNK